MFSYRYGRIFFVGEGTRAMIRDSKKNPNGEERSSWARCNSRRYLKGISLGDIITLSLYPYRTQE